jgi:hypothetical protein
MLTKGAISSMPIMMSKLYHALRAAGADDLLAQEAAEEAANYEMRFNALESKVDRLAERMEGQFRLLYWMIGFNLALTVTILWKLFK